MGCWQLFGQLVLCSDRPRVIIQPETAQWHCWNPRTCSASSVCVLVCVAGWEGQRVIQYIYCVSKQLCLSVLARGFSVSYSLWLYTICSSPPMFCSSHSTFYYKPTESQHHLTSDTMSGRAHLASTFSIFDKHIVLRCTHLTTIQANTAMQSSIRAALFCFAF